ncbi:sensor histidine kinase [Pelagibacterium montanilacus]|uniref:sensor histidine kinase n=1 Tax=Pelagibacterium montanilacus TaxID=2185280 RepID=UPI000F8C7CEE|nr:HWE histidine kinase domain-containing protein [Pelagibacterium montanilacus]
MTLDELYRMLRSSHVQSQGIVDTLREPLLVLDRNLDVINANPAFFRTFKANRDEMIGHNLFDLGNGQWDIGELRGLLADVLPKAMALVGYEVTQEFPEIGRRTMLVTARRLQHPDENSSQILVVFEDTTERKRTDSDKDILLAETRHRMKNLLSIMRAVASQTGTDGRSAKEYRDIVLGRFEAVTNAQMLISSNGSEAELSELLAQMLALATGARIKVAPSPPVVLAQHQVLPVSLILHELATNAFKYGALSNSSGVVHVSWTTGEHNSSECLVLSWREEGGPPVVPPARKGFGTDLIRHGATSEGGEVELDYDAAGLCARITLPIGGKGG